MAANQPNPYASPGECPDSLAEESVTAGSLPRPQKRRLDVGATIVTWEKRRLWYNLVLAAVSGPIVWVRLTTGDLALPDAKGLVLAAVIANFLFWAGPVVDGYWTWFLGPSRWLGHVLFFGG
ncbi:MAG: hypothetical protein KDA37_02695, partial [Planctomycetales bacterium]|nr:hypothetical protein [Planctomycetales bacterium]